MGQNPNSAQAPVPAARIAGFCVGVVAGSVDQRVIVLELSKSLDAKKLKEGDPVKAKTTGAVRAGDGTIVPIGSTVQGRITQATVRSKRGIAIFHWHRF